MFDVCPLFSSLLVVLESSRQNHNRPTKLFCRYTRLAQARSSSGHENRLSSQVDKISRDEKRDKLASPDLIPGEKERRWVFFCQEKTLTVLQIFEHLANGRLCSRYSCHAGVDSDYQTLQHIHSNITTINRFLVLMIVRL